MSIDDIFSSDGKLRNEFVANAAKSGGHRAEFVANRVSHSIGVIYILTAGFVFAMFVLRHSFVIFGYWLLKKFY
jgi:hypothetical protein